MTKPCQSAKKACFNSNTGLQAINLHACNWLGPSACSPSPVACTLTYGCFCTMMMPPVAVNGLFPPVRLLLWIDARTYQLRTCCWLRSKKKNLAGRLARCLVC
jgi:hypothetical protein